MIGNVRIAELRSEQAHDPQRGPFRVKAKQHDKHPKHYKGNRVHVDAFGQLFTVTT